MARIKGAAWVGGISFLAGLVWSVVGVAGNLDFLLQVSDSPTIRLLLRNPDTCLMVVGVLLLAFNLSRQPLHAFSRAYGSLRQRFKTRRWTDAGLSWTVGGHQLLKDGRMAAILAIAPIPGSELPQPLQVIVTCAGRIAEASSVFHIDADKAETPPRSGDVEIGAPEEKQIRLVLYSPKLLPPSRWDLTLISAGNTEVKVVELKRAPRRGDGPTRSTPPADSQPSTASGQGLPSS
jgi:hypothetical protein